MEGSEGDNILLSELDMGTPQGDSLAFIIFVGRDEDIVTPYPAAKDIAGTIYIFADGSQNAIEIPFARRENKSEVIIPFASTSSEVDSAIIYWNRDFELDYVAVAPINFTGFTEAGLLLDGVNHPNDIDAYIKLIDIDQYYTELDSVYQLSLSFVNIDPPGEGYERDYVLKTTGRYEVPGQGMYSQYLLQNNILNNVPFKNMLYTNYPNPFNPVTKINFEISKSSNVKLTIYNILGQEIRVLVNDVRNPGIYTVDFDGSNLPSGLYIYKLETPYFNDAKKMVLLK